MKNTRTITYRKHPIPAIIIEGKWLTEKYGLQLGDEVELEYRVDKIIIKTKKQ